MERLNNLPVLGNVLALIDRYPRISAWIVLSVGVVGLLVYEAQDVGLTTRNWIALIVASVVVSGLCIWIVSWEDEEVMMGEDEQPAMTVKSEQTEPAESAPSDNEAAEA